MTSVSVIIPAYGREDLACASVQSALNQTMPPAEVIVVDDHSPTRIELPGIADRRVKLLRLNQRGGAAHARNYGAACARGDILAFLDHDDLWHPRTIEQHLVSYDSGDWDATYALGATVSRQVLTGRGAPHEVPLSVACIATRTSIHSMSCFTIRRHVYVALGGLSTEPTLAHCEDLELYLRLCTYYRVGMVPFFLVHRRFDGTNLTADCEAWSRSLCALDRLLAESWHGRFCSAAWRHGLVRRQLGLLRRSSGFVRATIATRLALCMVKRIATQIAHFQGERNGTCRCTAAQMSPDLVRNRIVVHVGHNLMQFDTLPFRCECAEALGALLKNKHRDVCLVSLSATRTSDDRVPLSLLALYAGMQDGVRGIVGGGTTAHNTIAQCAGVITSSPDLANAAVGAMRSTLLVRYNGYRNYLLELLTPSGAGVASAAHGCADLARALADLLPRLSETIFGGWACAPA